MLSFYPSQLRTKKQALFKQEFDVNWQELKKIEKEPTSVKFSLWKPQGTSINIKITFLVETKQSKYN
jgi:hypothetical protein